MTQLIDGKKTASQIRLEIAAEVELLKQKKGRPPHLAAVLVGEDTASKTYVSAKEKACKKVGFTSSIIELKGSVSEAKLLQIIEKLNSDRGIDGFIVQLPLPSHISTTKIIEHINPAKDIDGFHPLNTGKMTAGLPCFLPATPKGIVELLKRYDIETVGKHCVVVGRSNIVGTPLSIMLSRKDASANCTVTLCHSRTRNISDFTKMADILVVALGKKKFIKKEMIKSNAVVIDVGIHREAIKNRPGKYKLVGDVDFEDVFTKCAFITPVPGGVGPMTITSLLQNNLQAYKLNNINSTNT